MELLAGFELKDLVLVLGAAIGVLFITNLGAFITGAIAILKYAYKAGQENQEKIRMQRDINAAHAILREMQEADSDDGDDLYGE